MTKLYDERYSFIAQENYKNRLANQKTAMQLQGDYGKWLLNTLLILNGGAIIGAAQSSSLGRNVLHDAGMWFIVGIVTALICGFIAWINWSLHAHLYEGLADPAMVFDHEKWPNASRRQAFWINATYLISIASGVGSVGCLVVGAWVARSTMTLP